MKLLFITNYVPYFLSHRMPLTQAALDAGFEVHIAIPPHPDLQKMTTLPVTLHPYTMSRTGINPLEILSSCKELRKIIAQVKPDIVHNLPLKSCLYGNLALKKFQKVPSVSSINGLGYLFIGSGIKKKLMRKCVLTLLRYAFSRRHKKVLFQNTDDRNVFTESHTLQNESTQIIPGSGVDTKKYKFTPEPEDGMRIVFPARLLHDKGIREFVHAAHRLKEHEVQAEFILAGDLDPLNPSAASKEEVELWQQQGIKWIGHCEDMAALYASCHIVCLPSYREGLSKSLIEALSCGRAVCTTDTPGCNLLVPPEHKDLLSPVGDSQKLADNLLRLIKSRTLREKLGKWGRQQAEDIYSLESINRQTLTVYAKLLQKSGTQY